MRQKTGPVALGAAAANIFQGGNGDATLRDVITHIRVTNKTSAAAWFSLYIGATGGSAAGTEIAEHQNVDAYKSADIYCATPVSATEYLTGLASAAATLTITVDRERVVI